MKNLSVKLITNEIFVVALFGKVWNLVFGFSDSVIWKSCLLLMSRSKWWKENNITFCLKSSKRLFFKDTQNPMHEFLLTLKWYWSNFCILFKISLRVFHKLRMDPIMVFQQHLSSCNEIFQYCSNSVVWGV